MSRRLISTGSPFEKAAGFSRAVADGDFCFVAGTTGYDYATMIMPPGRINLSTWRKQIGRTCSHSSLPSMT